MVPEGTYLRKVAPDDARPGEERVSRTSLYPMYHSHADGGDTEVADPSMLRRYWRAICHRRWLIIAITLIATTLVATWMCLTESNYRATAIIEVGKEDTTLIQVSENLIIQNDDTPKTKSVILKSTPLLEDVIVSLQLDKNDGFLEDITGVPGEANQSQRGVETTSGLREESNRNLAITERQRLNQLIVALEDGLEIEEVLDTRLLKVSFTHTAPAMAAAVANAVVENLIKRSLEGKTEKFSQASSWLEQETLKLKQKMEAGEQELASYTRAHNVVSPDGTSNVTLDKLSRLHSEVMRAEAERILKGSIHEEVRNGRIAQVPEAFMNTRAVELQRKIGELSTTAAQLDANYGAESPEVVEVQQQIAAVQKQIDANTRLLGDKLKGDYERARRDEQALKGLLFQARSEAVQQNQTSLRFSILKAQFDTAKALYNEFLQKTNQANFQVAQQQNNLRVIQPAREPEQASSPKRSLIIGLGFILSLAVGVGLALLLDHFDNSIKSIEDVHQHLQLPALGVIPAMSTGALRLPGRKLEGKRVGVIGPNVLEKVTRRPYNSRSLAADAYRVLRTSLLLSSVEKAPKTILVTSTKSGEGKTTTVANMATSLAQLGATVLIIDCDLRKPAVHKLFGVSKDPGLSTYLSSDACIETLIRRLPPKELWLLPAGTATVNPAELLSSERMRALLRMLTTRFDHVLIDAPPLVNLAEPLVVSTMVDGVILVVDSGRSERDAVLRARDELLSVGADIFGVVLNNVDFRREGLGHYYEHYYAHS